MDGGVIAQVFTYPAHTIMALNKITGTPFRRELHVYVIRNGKLKPERSGTKRRTLSIGGRAISTLVQAQGLAI